MRTQFGVLLDKGGNFYDIGSGCGKVVGAEDLMLESYGALMMGN